MYKRIFIFVHLVITLPLSAFVSLDAIAQSQRVSVTNDFLGTSAPTPEAPQGFKGGLFTGDDIRLSWQPVAGADYYERQRKIDLGDWGKIRTSTETTLDLYNHIPGKYTYRVRACTNNPYCSVWVEIDAISIFAPSLWLTAEQFNGNDIRLSWAPVEGAEVYKYSLVGKEDEAREATGTSIELFNHHEGDYTYQIAACSHEGDCSLWTQAENIHISYKPASVTAEIKAGTGNDVELTWASVAGAPSYEREIKTKINGSWGAWGDNRSYTDTQVILYNYSEGEYAYRVRGCPPEGTCDASSWTESAAVYIDQTPKNMTATLAGGNDITLSWERVLGAARYERQKQVDGVWEDKLVPAPETGLTHYNHANGKYVYRVRSCPSTEGACSKWATSKEITVSVKPSWVNARLFAGNDIELSWASVVSNTRYEWEVNHNNGGWKKRQSTSATSIKLYNHAEGRYQYRVRACSATYCTQDWAYASSVDVSIKPTWVNAELFAGNDIELSWASMTGAERYEWEVNQNNGGWTKRQSTTATSIKLYNHLEGRYQYRVRACPSTGSCSGWVNAPEIEVSFTLAWFKAELFGGNDIKLTWSEISGIKHYERQKSVNGVWENKLRTSTGGRLDLYNHPPAKYVYRVRACLTDSDCYAWSTSQEITVK